MNRLSEGKLSTTMKDAMIRNSIAEQKMKTVVSSLNTESKKQIDSLSYQRGLYEKRRAVLELKTGGKKFSLHQGSRPSPQSEPSLHDRSRSLNSRPGGQYDRSRSLSPRKYSTSTNCKYPDLTSFKSNADLCTQIDNGQGDGRRRAISLASAPSIEIYETEDEVELVELPPILSLNGLQADKPRSKSVGEYDRESTQNQKTSLTPRLERLNPNTSDSKKTVCSAPSSPLFTRKRIGKPGNQLPMAFPREKISSEMCNLTTGLITSNVLNVDSFDIRSSQSLEPRKEISQQTWTGKSKKTSKGMSENSKLGGRDDVGALAASMKKLKFCKYLRGNDVYLENEDKLPEELIPRCLIMGHTKITMNKK